jgi:CheY-like chemotaxis protein
MAERYVLVVEDDLLFASKLGSALRGLNLAWERAASPSAALSQVERRAPALVVVNLACRGFDPVAVIRTLKAHPHTHRVPLLGFVGHKDRRQREAARAAGADIVVANSVIALRFAALVRKLLAGPAGA